MGPLGDGIGYIKLISHMGDDHFICENARVTSGSHGKDNEKLLRYLMKHNHTTPFEFVQFVFEVKAPIFVARQWVRHRMSTWNEVSGRYTELKDEFYVRKHWNAQDLKNRQGSTEEVVFNGTVKWVQEEAYIKYLDLLSRGVSREQARIILPLNLYTTWRWRIDLHNLMHFLRLRLDPHAQEEIRKYAEGIKTIITPIVPLTMGIFNEQRT